MSPASPRISATPAEITQPRIEAPPLPSGGRAAHSGGTAATQQPAASTSPQKESAAPGRAAKTASGLFDSGWGKLGTLVAGWTGFGGVAFAAGWYVAGRLVKRRIRKRLAKMAQAGGDDKNVRYIIEDERPRQPITDTRLLWEEIEVDDFQTAFVEACKELIRRQPGDRDLIHQLDRMIRQVFKPQATHRRKQRQRGRD